MDLVDDRTIDSRDSAMRQQVNAAAWTERKAEVASLLQLLEIHSRNYRLAKEQSAKWGSALLPPIIQNNLEESENGVADTVAKLQKCLTAVYGADVRVPTSEA